MKGMNFVAGRSKIATFTQRPSSKNRLPMKKKIPVATPKRARKLADGFFGVAVLLKGL